MKERRHIHVIVREDKNDYKLLVLHQTHIGDDFAGDITTDENGMRVIQPVFPPDQKAAVFNGAGATKPTLRYDGGTPAFALSSEGTWTLFLLGDDVNTRKTPISIPKKYYPEVRDLINAYNKYFEEEAK